jgi:hypothetical protein
MRADVVDRQNVRMIQRRNCSPPARNAAAVCTRCQCFRQHLDGYIATAASVARAIHFAQPTAIELDL